MAVGCFSIKVMILLKKGGLCYVLLKSYWFISEEHICSIINRLGCCKTFNYFLYGYVLIFVLLMLLVWKNGLSLSIILVDAKRGNFLVSVFGEIPLDFVIIYWSGCNCSRWERGGAIYWVSHPYKWNEFLYIIINLS